ncbi:MAG: GtrA family protein, partial [Anaerobutyricum sp.]|nr:GtrA family protein [Anaerobutyricum sp.]
MKKIFDKYFEIISYLFWGVCTTIVNWGTYSVFVAGFHWGIFLGNACSWACATLFAYVTNKLWVFQSKSWKREVVFKEFGLFVSSRLLTGTLEIIGVPFLVKMGLNYSVMGIEGLFAKVLVSVLVVILNYILSKLVIF